MDATETATNTTYNSIICPEISVIPTRPGLSRGLARKITAGFPGSCRPPLCPPAAGPFSRILRFSLGSTPGAARTAVHGDGTRRTGLVHFVSLPLPAPHHRGRHVSTAAKPQLWREARASGAIVLGFILIA